MRALPFDDPSTAVRFLSAGQATFTLRSVKTGHRFTFRLRRQEDSPPHSPRYWVDHMTGRDNEHDFTYLGILGSGVFQVTKATRHMERAPQAEAIRYLSRNLWDRKRLPPNMEIWHESRCGRCGRPLTVPESIRDGIGPECRKML